MTSAARCALPFRSPAARPRIRSDSRRFRMLAVVHDFTTASHWSPSERSLLTLNSLTSTLHLIDGAHMRSIGSDDFHLFFLFP